MTYRHWLMLSCLWIVIGCTGNSSNREQTIPIEESLVNEVQVSINGQDLESATVQVVAGEVFHLDAQYIRPADSISDWDTIVALLVNNDVSEKTPAGIQYRYGLVRNDIQIETQNKEKELVWKCQLNDGTEGRKLPMRVEPGFYELRLCWEDAPETVEEKIAVHEDPTLLQTPFYSTIIEVIE